MKPLIILQQDRDNTIRRLKKIPYRKIKLRRFLKKALKNLNKEISKYYD